MKKILAITAVITTVAASAVDLIVPKTDDRTINRHPLDEGRVSYQDLDNGNASLLIGKKGDPHPYRVVDPLTIRGYRSPYLYDDEYSVSYTAGFSYAGADDKYVLNNTLNVTNRIIFTALGNRKISSIDYFEKNATSGIEQNCCKVTKEVTEHQVIITVVRTLAGTYYIQEPILYGEQEGSEFEYTDLVDDLHIRVKDSIGKDDLSNWRNWAKHSNDGNLGEDWYKYEADGSVYMNANPSTTITNRYDIKNYGYSFNGVNALKGYYKLFYDRATTNLVLKAGQFYPIEVMARGMGAPTDFGFTSIVGPYVESGNTNVLFTVQAPDPAYNINLVSIYYTDSLATNSAGQIVWQLIPNARLTKNGFVVMANVNGLPNADRAQFFRFVYGGVDMASCVVFFRENVLVEDDMQVNGNLGIVESLTLSNSAFIKILKPGGLKVVGDDLLTYELHINGGVATWTAVP